MKNRIIIALMVTGTLMGCSTYSDSLDQKLTGKSTEEKRTVLAKECGDEIAKGLKKDDPANVRHSEKMKQICEEMTGKKIKID
ncbi:MAG: hypothetical protein SFW62_06375 [Alphaproteobacteria bacterium]|nr:hypothetical protein [Alphaproteobacteria bacterium]